MLLLSDLALHTRNIKGDMRVSLLIHDEAAVQAGVDPLTTERITITGRIARIADKAARRRFLAWQPSAAGFADFADFGVYRIVPERVHTVAGFGRITTCPAGEVFLDAEAAAEFESGEESAIGHMNADHADAVAAYAAGAGAAKTEGWRISGCDPDGAYLVREEVSLRIAFESPAIAFSGLRTAFANLSKSAKG